MYQIEISKKAEKQLPKLSKSFQNSFVNEIKKIASEPYKGKQLKYNNKKKYFSWRTGDYRIVYEIDDVQHSVKIIAVGHRKNIYEVIRRLLAILFSI